MKYTSWELKDYDGSVPQYELTANGKLVLTGNSTEIDTFIRNTLYAGDTYQEQYDNGGESDVLSFDDMLNNWKTEDSYRLGKPDLISKLTEAEKARLFALKFRQEYPDLIRPAQIDLTEAPHLEYGEVPVLDSGNVGLYHRLGHGGVMNVATGNILVYDHGDYRDYSVIVPNMTLGDVFTEDERQIAEGFILEN